MSELEQMSERELLEYMAYYTLEPWGHRQEWLRAGTVAAAAANAPYWKPKGDGLTALDFAPKVRKPDPEPQSPKSFVLALKLMAQAHNKAQEQRANGHV